MPGSTPKGAPYSLGTDTADTIDTTMQALAEWTDARPGVSPLTTAQRDALAGADLWDGRIIWNTTDARLQRYNAGTATWFGVVAADSDKLGGMSAPLYLLTSDANAAYLSERSIPAGALAPGTGVPTLGVTGSFYPVWLLDSATSESVCAVLRVPDGWASVAVDVYFVNPAASTGDFVQRYIYQSIAPGAAFVPEGGSPIAVTALGQNVLQKHTIFSGLAVGAGRSILVGVERQGANAADTLANDIGVLSFVVRKVS